MNRYLLAGCAAVALAMASGAANAQAKFEVKVGGDVLVEGGWVDEDLAPAGGRETELRNRWRLNVIPSAKADNGLEYGARLRLRMGPAATASVNNPNAGTGSDIDRDRAFLFVQSAALGQLRLGETNSFNDDTGVVRPFDYLPLGIYNISAGWTTGENPHWPFLDQNGNASKIVYYSPRFAGLQLGASYTPRNNNFGLAVDRASDVVTTATLSDAIEVGANYNATFGGFGVKASAGYMWADVTGAGGIVGIDDLKSWQFGGQVSYAGFAVGGGYTNYGRVANVETNKLWNAGAQYTMGPIIAGVGYTHATGGAAGVDTTKIYEVGASYTVAPGLSVGASYHFVNVDGTTAATDNDANVVLLRSVLAF